MIWLSYGCGCGLDESRCVVAHCWGRLSPGPGRYVCVWGDDGVMMVGWVWYLSGLRPGRHCWRERHHTRLLLACCGGDTQRMITHITYITTTNAPL